MKLYSGTSTDFISDSVHNRIADKLAEAFNFGFRRAPSPGEVSSWRNSLRAMSQVIDNAKLHDHGVLLEYELPMTSRRLDCMITGRDSALRDQAVIVELKQWEKCEDGDGDMVVTFVGGGLRDVLHPSIQVGNYRSYLADLHTAFYEGDSPVGLSACSYLHNYSFDEGDVLLSPKFESVVETCPVFSADDVAPLSSYLAEKMSEGQGMQTLSRVLESKFRPSKKLLDHVGRIVDGRSDYVLLDEQLIAFNRVLAEAQAAHTGKGKTAILIRGGPGTGKSVIALNLLAELSKRGLNAQYVTGSKAFTTSLKKIVGTRAAAQLRYTSDYQKAEFNDVDVLICDEAHRIREKTFNRFRPFKTDLLQVEELFNASKVSVFFVDDQQVVRPQEIGSSRFIRDVAKKQDIQVFDYQLEAQFRCNGSDGFINWVNNTLEIQRTANVLWNLSDQFDFRILSTPLEVDAEIKQRLNEGFTARMTAGFCWEWSDPLPDGSLVPDVQVGSFSRPWNAKSGKGRLAKHIPPESLWAYDPKGVDQVGCIYTAQGFEFDYVGVIFGTDLVYRPGLGWHADKKVSHDSVVKRSGDQFMDLVKNTYRVLCTRGMKGCYVCFLDKETENFVRSRTERVDLQSPVAK
jgi:hypothetical protein